MDKDKLYELLAVLPADQKRAIRRIIDNNCSLLNNNFDFSATEFRDALCVRYRKPLKRSLSRCDGGQQDFDLQHALSCKKSGLVTLRHNEIRVTVGDLVDQPDVENGTPALIADLSARGVWDRQSAASFDISVTDTDAPFYQNRNPMNVLKTAEIEKKNKYEPACEEKHMSFTTLVTSIDGVLAPEFTFFSQTTSRCSGIKMGPPI